MEVIMKKKQYSVKEVLQGMAVEIGFVGILMLAYIGLTWILMR